MVVEEVASGGRAVGKGFAFIIFKLFIMCICMLYIMGERVLEIPNVGHQVWEAPLLSLFTSPGRIDFRVSSSRHGSQE